MKRILPLFFTIIACISCNENKQNAITSILFAESNKTLELGKSEQLTVKHSPDNIQAPTYNWHSSDPDIVSVDGSGKITAMNVGRADIRAYTNDNINATCAIVVPEIDAQSIKINKQSTTLFIDQKETLTATIIPEKGTNKSIKWSTSDLFIVTIGDDGIINGRRAGKATITATTSNGIAATCEVTVQRIAVTSISINPTSTTIDLGAEVEFAYTLDPQNATPINIIWSSSNNETASISEGVCKGLKEGDAIITATTEDGLLSASATLTVKDLTSYCKIGEPSVSKYGIECTMNSIIISNSETAQICTINYTIKNITKDKKLSEMTFQCKKVSGEYELQYGFFDNLYPNEQKTRSYTFKTFLYDPFQRIELSTIFAELIDSTKPELFWKAQ